MKLDHIQKHVHEILSVVGTDNGWKSKVMEVKVIAGNCSEATILQTGRKIKEFMEVVGFVSSQSLQLP